MTRRNRQINRFQGLVLTVKQVEVFNVEFGRFHCVISKFCQ
ncbi:Uncharacterised protein [Vibrio cholerae]|nr:Uncharacterised protein [Vibrio cholerae]